VVVVTTSGRGVGETGTGSDTDGELEKDMEVLVGGRGPAHLILDCGAFSTVTGKTASDVVFFSSEQC